MIQLYFDRAIAGSGDQSPVGGVKCHAGDLFFSVSVGDVQSSLSGLHVPQRHGGVDVTSHHLSEGGVEQSTGDSADLRPTFPSIVHQPSSLELLPVCQVDQSQVVSAAHY